MHVKNSRNYYIVHSIAFFPPTTIFLGCCCFLKFFAVILHFVCNCVSEKKEKCCGNRGEIWYNFILTTILIMFNIIKVLRKDITKIFRINSLYCNEFLPQKYLEYFLALPNPYILHHRHPMIMVVQMMTMAVTRTCVYVVHFFVCVYLRVCQYRSIFILCVSVDRCAFICRYDTQNVPIIFFVKIIFFVHAHTLFYLIKGLLLRMSHLLDYRQGDRSEQFHHQPIINTLFRQNQTILFCQ